MTIKNLSKKHVIVPISNDNRIKFIKDSSTYITNINRILKGIKLEVIADFIHFDQAGIIVVTNKVTSTLDLQTIENYIKNVNCIKADGIGVSYLS